MNGPLSQNYPMFHTFSDTQGLNYDQVALEIEIFGKITSCWLIVWTFTFYVACIVHNMMYIWYIMAYFLVQTLTREKLEGAWMYPEKVLTQEDPSF